MPGAPAEKQAGSDRYPQALVRPIITQGERRHLTILFTDLTGYTRLMETYDPEDIQAMMAAIVHHCNRIITSYNGYVERVLGDEILGLFGFPKAHEDDAIRAIKAAREIHETVSEMRPASIQPSERIAMHTGINTGLVVTSRPSRNDGSFDLSGDAVNLASRLSDLAKPDEILVGPETYRQAFGFFDFNAMPAMKIKGKSLPISVHSVVSEKDRPMTGKRELKLTAALVGRQDELNLLMDAMTALEAGNGSIISIIGEAGTGKSRLLLEFEKQLAGRQINWITGYAYAHTQHVPFFPLMHIVRRWLELNGSATEQQMRAGIARRVGELLGSNAEEIPIIQGLIGLDVQETAGMSPEVWHTRLTSAMLNLLSAIARQMPTVFCMEDIHWGDSASFKLLKDIIFNFQHPAIVIYTLRPHASLFTSHEQEIVAPLYKEIRLSELSPSQAEDMMRSMLNTDILPQDLCRLIHHRAEGNPFFLEEILNALVDSRALVFENGRWRLHRGFKESDIPSTIHGVIASRMDQLNPKEKRILQEAAVIGRAFLYDLLKQISTHQESVDSGLYRLERAGLIILRSLHPEMEFMCKHALVQEVSYRSLLRRERQQIHERIGHTIERIYKDRLSEFDETLALHFRKSRATSKAVDYLIRSGTKALRRNALDESDHYFSTAKSLLENQPSATPEIKKRMLDVIHQWAFSYYYKGWNRALLKQLEQHLSLIDGLNDPVREGYHWAWHGCALWHRHRFCDAYDSLNRALRLGESADHPGVTALAGTWLSWICSELGRFGDAMQNSRRAQDLFEQKRINDPYIYFHSLFGTGYAAWHLGDIHLTGETGTRLIQYGKQHAHVRSLVAGHCCHGWRDLIAGHVDRATDHFKTAIQISADPWYSQFPKLALTYALISNQHLEEALPLLDELIAFSDQNGAEFVGEPAYFFKGLTSILQGQVTEGLNIMETRLERWKRSGSRLRCMTCGYVMAGVYLRLLRESIKTTGGRGSLQTSQFADKTIAWFRSCITDANDMGASAMHGQALLGLGHTWIILGKPDEARQALTQCMRLLEQSNAEEYLKQAKTLIGSIQTDPK
jgi:class 3 adenylate cyclase/tetratricopeptide (TPR) repeat protein